MSEKVTYEPQSRSGARLGAVQALYQMEAAATPVEVVIEQFVHHRFGVEVDGVHLPQGDETFFTAILTGTIENQVFIDRTVNDILAAGWRLERLDATVRAILRAGAFELIYREDVPPKVVISEYVRLAESFFEGEEVGFVNGILDKIARDHREQDMAG